jgi:threonyl-tRNA synthetase
MKTLNLHTEYIKFKPLKKALKSMEPLSDSEKEEISVKDALAVMTAVEKGDEDVKGVVAKLVEEVKKIADQINVKNVVLYPYAHLSSNLASPNVAIEVLNLAEKELKKFFNVAKAPFGYYKEFEMKVKGHPLSELSREIKVDGSKIKIHEPELSKDERARLLKSMTKNKIQSIRGKNDLKSNVELGKELDLYIINEVVGKGLPLFTPKGTSILRRMRRFIEDEELRRGYEYTQTPILAKSDLYKISGHWQHYKEDMFVTDVYGDDYALRPMTCPFQFVLFKRKARTYKDLPKKYAEIATLYRKEQTGELRGLTRMWQFNLADAHIICEENQVEKEFEKVLDLIKFVMEKLGINDTWYRFSKWDPKNERNKYINNPKAWEKTQVSMKKILDKLGLDYVEAEDEAAFYGPKLDLQFKDVYGKEDSLFTIQIDFALPEKFDLTYKDKNGKEKRPMIIHRSSIGAPERTLSHLLELTQGKLPLWLSPNQVKVMTMNDSVKDYAKEIKDKFFDAGFEVELDDRSGSIGKKARDAQIQKYNYLVTVGDSEAKEGKIAVKVRDDKNIETMSVDEFISKLQKEIAERV